MDKPIHEYGAFSGNQLLFLGDLRGAVGAAKDALGNDGTANVRLYDGRDGQAIDLDLRGSADEVQDKLLLHPVLGPRIKPPKRGPGRPKLGVVAREVSLLPRHWDWLSRQKGGSSGALRRLVDAARKDLDPGKDHAAAAEAAHQFLWDIAGDQPGFEEVSRKLFAFDFDAVRTLTAEWPEGVRRMLEMLLSRTLREE